MCLDGVVQAHLVVFNGGLEIEGRHFMRFPANKAYGVEISVEREFREQKQRVSAVLESVKQGFIINVSSMDFGLLMFDIVNIAGFGD